MEGEGGTKKLATRWAGVRFFKGVNQLARSQAWPFLGTDRHHAMVQQAIDLVEYALGLRPDAAGQVGRYYAGEVDEAVGLDRAGQDFRGFMALDRHRMISLL